MDTVRALTGLLVVLAAACGPPPAESASSALHHRDLRAVNTDVPLPAPDRLVLDGPPRASRSQHRPAARPTPLAARHYEASSGGGWGLPPLLRRIGGCESSGRPDGPLDWGAVNRQGSSASGAFQVLDGTWDGYAGYRRARDAPPAVQVAWALEAYRQRGTRPWRTSQRCWA